MPRKRKLLLGNEPIGGKALKSRRVARSVTSKYHEIRNELQSLSTLELPPKMKKEKQKALETKLIDIGGIQKYQQASVISTQHFKTSRWIVKTLSTLLKQREEVSQISVKFKTLEVGAINTQLLRIPWLGVRAIDIHSVNPAIEECDFFTIKPLQHYDVVVCSMVVNCVTDPFKRFEMIARLKEHLSGEGVLFLVLPLRCIESKFLGTSRFEELISGLGFVELIPKRKTPKVVFYVLGKRADQKSSEDKTTAKILTQSSQTIEDWAWRTQQTLTLMLPDTVKYFTRDCANVPPSVFSLCIPPMFLP